MKLPNYEHAVVPERKITAYLLSSTHPDGQSKAAYFVRFGFSTDNWSLLAAALLQHAATYEVVVEQVTPFGKSYAVDGPLVTPDGRNPSVRVIWFIEVDSTIPRLVTAYPP